MQDEATIPRVTEAISRRLANRLSTVLDEEPRALNDRLAALDDWTLATLLRLSRRRAAEQGRAARTRHLGVVGVDHSLNRLVVEETDGSTPVEVDLDSLDLNQLDDEDLIAAAHYVPETLPGYLLG